MSAAARSSSRRLELVPWAIVYAGVALELLYLGSMLALGGLSAVLSPDGLAGIAITVPFVGGIVYAGVRLRRGGLSVARYRRVAGWALVVGGAYLGLNLVLIAAFTTGSLVDDVAWAMLAAQIGVAGGLVVGFIEARAIERAVTAEREAVRAEQMEEQRDWFAYLNSLLRHEVLNSAHLISGYVELLSEDPDLDEDVREYVERIGRRSRKMSEVIQDVRVLLEANEDPSTFEPVDVVEILEAEIETLRREHDAVTVETSWPESAPVLADDLLPRVFSNLLSNAVEHNDAELPIVRVSVEAADDRVVVRIADNGPGIPEPDRETLFEREGAGDHGLGLYLVERLVDRFDGTIELTETGPEGTTFTVELPRATAEAEAHPDAATPAVDTT